MTKQTEPVSYVPRDLSSGVVAMRLQTWGEDANTTEVMDWILETLSENATSSFDGMQSFWVEDGDFTIQVTNGQFVWLDEEGFHATSEGAFELALRKAPPI